MKIASITAGAAGMFCGSCLHDNAVAMAMYHLGDDVSLIPTYTPIRTDQQSLAIDRVFLGGISVYLKHQYPFTRYFPKFLFRMLDRPKVINWFAQGSIETDAKFLGAMTLNVLKGQHGPFADEVKQLVDFLVELKPDVVVLTNLLIGGIIPAIEARVNAPIAVTLQGDDLFLDGLVEPYRTQVIEQMSKLARQVDGFVTFSDFYANQMSQKLNLDRSKFHLVPLGIEPANSLSSQIPSSNLQLAQARSLIPTIEREHPLVLGYMARICPEKGFDLLVDAFIELAQQPGLSDLQLRSAGWLSKENEGYLAAQVEKISNAGLAQQFEHLGVVDHDTKHRHLCGLDVLCVPTRYHEPKGLFALEALSRGVPIVLPSHGAFPELIAQSNGGLLFDPAQPGSLVDTLGVLLHDASLRRELGSAGQHAVQSHYNINQAANMTRAVYQTLIEQRNRT